MPQLASSDSLDSELNTDEIETRRRLKKRRSRRKQQRHLPLSSSSELIVEMDNRDSIHGQNTDESHGTIDSAIQCTLIMNGHEEQRRKSTRSSAVQVSLVSDNDILR